MKFLQVNEVYECKYIPYVNKAYSCHEMVLIPVGYRPISDAGTVICTVHFIHSFIPLHSMDPIKVRETFWV